MTQDTPALSAEMLLGMYRPARRGDFAVMNLTSGRRPQTIGNVLATVLKPSTARQDIRSHTRPTYAFHVASPIICPFEMSDVKVVQEFLARVSSIASRNFFWE